ncbi:hypothetical protein D1AOALGA4SA_1679 [Olavius algarvensis Delta 1 endosymbiont]|nr:hypothetical protein D1AOALGA4SA_1679 [Olavius algarvensis Delta 1 endosymbiont]
MRILDLRYPVYFTSRKSDTRRMRLRCASDTVDPISEIQNLQ